MPAPRAAMEFQQDHFVGAALAQAELFKGLTERLDGWSDLIIAGNHETLVEFLGSNDLNNLVESVQTGRSVLKMLQQPKQESAESRLALTELTNAYQNLVFSNNRLRLLVNRGMLFTRTMLNAMAGDRVEGSTYSGNAMTGTGTNNNGQHSWHYLQGEA